MLSEFGKFTRKLRIDEGELLKDMAQKLAVTTSYLSAIEIGKRNIPTSWRDILIDMYELNSDEVDELNEAIYNSQKVLKLDLGNLEQNDKSLMLTFARKFDELEDSQKEKIEAILNKRRR